MEAPVPSPSLQMVFTGEPSGDGVKITATLNGKQVAYQIDPRDTLESVAHKIDAQLEQQQQPPEPQAPVVCSPTQPDIDNSAGPPYTQADPSSSSSRKRKTRDDSDILSQVDRTKDDLNQLAAQLAALDINDEKSCAFRDVVVYDMWRSFGEFFRHAMSMKKEAKSVLD